MQCTNSPTNKLLKASPTLVQSSADVSMNENLFFSAHTDEQQHHYLFTKPIRKCTNTETGPTSAHCHNIEFPLCCAQLHGKSVGTIVSRLCIPT